MIHVPGYGPYGARLVIVGEGPGKQEEIKGRPFVGMTGDFMRGCVQRAGMDPDDVRWDNAVDVRTKVPGDVRARLKYIEKYAGTVEDSLLRCPDAVVVACGGLALLKLTGMTNITNAAGMVLKTDHGRLVVPVLHPAGVMRGKIQAERLFIQKHIERAVRLAKGELKYEVIKPEIIDVLNVYDFMMVTANANTIVIDTEFNPDTRTTKVVGFATDEEAGRVVYQVPGNCFDKDMIREWDKVLRDTDIRKVAHFQQADRDALAWLGCDVRETAGWFDTLAAFSTLYPDLPCGLSHVARYYLDNVGDWKSMDKEDPVYNALDVSYTYEIHDALCQDLAETGMWDVFETEVMPTLPLLHELEAQGIQVDKATCRAERNKRKKEVKKLTKDIVKEVGEIFEKRREPLHKEIAIQTYNIEKVEQMVAYDVERGGVCPVHPTYTGLRKKRWATDDKCTCATIYKGSFCGKGRDSISSSRSEITKAKGKLKRWEKGFDPGNNDHLRWLLYDKAGLKLPVQKDPQTRRPTANATAIARLISLKGVQKRAGVVKLLQSIKRVQHLEKMISTFLKPPVDKDWVVHPPYRMRTGTGRPAGGDDVMTHEKGVGEYKFNALNIPEECRGIYVPFEERMST